MDQRMRVTTDTGIVEGFGEHGGLVRTFRGIPFAAPPTGPLRWRPPQATLSWEGVRPARDFGPRCTQARVFADMIFRDEMAEDCLYLNVWTPAGAKQAARLPVMLWIHGGGFVAGSASEPRQDGGRLAQQNVVVVGINYRLGVFGFFAHPELSAESKEHAASSGNQTSGKGASGNQGLLDQVTALEWVDRNINAFGGDPDNVTIFGESAGSFSVSALMAAPPARGLFHRAIGESGAFFPSAQQTLAPKTLAESEAQGVAFAEALDCDSIASLRAKSADDVLKTAAAQGRFSPTLDGHLLTRPAGEVFAAGEQSPVPLLAGWNADELRAMVTLSGNATTAESFIAQTRSRFGDAADSILAVYPASSDLEALESAASLASDLFVGHATWKWIETHEETGHAPVYRFSFERRIPIPVDGWNGRPATSTDIGARHAGEIEYVFGTLDSQPTVPWEPEDGALSALMLAYWANFARDGDPNADGLPVWPRYREEDGKRLMHLDAASLAGPDLRRPRYETLDSLI